jgi:hypothetical protein
VDDGLAIHPGVEDAAAGCQPADGRVAAFAVAPKNFRERRPVSLRMRGREVRGTAFAVKDPEAVAERFAYYLVRNPHEGRYFGVRVGRDGRADPDELARAAARLVMIRTRLDGGTRSP